LIRSNFLLKEMCNSLSDMSLTQRTLTLEILFDVPKF